MCRIIGFSGSNNLRYQKFRVFHLIFKFCNNFVKAFPEEIHSIGVVIFNEVAYPFQRLKDCDSVEKNIFNSSLKS